MTKLQQAHAQIADALGDLADTLFVRGMKLTLVARKPGNTECELVVSDDDLAEAVAVVERSRSREAIQPGATP